MTPREDSPVKDRVPTLADLVQRATGGGVDTARHAETRARVIEEVGVRPHSIMTWAIATACLSVILATIVWSPHGKERATSDPAIGPVSAGEPRAADLGGDAAVAKLRPSFRACYQAELARGPVLDGKVVFEVTVAADGSARGVKVESRLGLSDELVGCLGKVLEGASFAGSEGRTLVVPVSFVSR